MPKILVREGRNTVIEVRGSKERVTAEVVKRLAKGQVVVGGDEHLLKDADPAVATMPEPDPDPDLDGEVDGLDAYGAELLSVEIKAGSAGRTKIVVDNQTDSEVTVYRLIGEKSGEIVVDARKKTTRSFKNALGKAVTVYGDENGEDLLAFMPEGDTVLDSI